MPSGYPGIFHDKKALKKRWDAARKLLPNYPELQKADSEHHRKYYLLHKEKIKARSARRRIEKKAEIAAWFRKTNLANPQYNRDRVKNWRLKNPEKYKALMRHRSGRRKERQKCTPEEAVKIKSFMRHHLKMRWHRCYYCDKDFTGMIHFDHIVPLARNGKHEAANLCVSCPACNLEKATREISNWKKKGQQILPI